VKSMKQAFAKPEVLSHEQVRFETAMSGNCFTCGVTGVTFCQVPGTNYWVKK
jgi:hypothetical protein